jgi:hypothetical protein
MKQANRSAKTDVRSTRPRTVRHASYEPVIDGLVSEMARLIDTKELCRFSPPFQLVIIGNRGRVAFAGQVDRDGEVRPTGPLRKLRRSDFPANALITDRSLAMRTFRIDCADAEQ